MLIGWCIIYLSVILLTGAAAIRIIAGNEQRSIPEAFGLSITLGFGIAGTFLLLVSLLGIAPGRMVILLLGAIAAGTVIACRAKKRSICFTPPRFGRALLELFSLLLAIGLLLTIGITAIIAMSYPIFDWDALMIWGLKAKVLYGSALTPRPAYFTDLRYNFSHLDYPLLLPMLLAGAYGAVNSVQEQLARSVLPLLFFGQILTFYSGARLLVSRPAALLLTLLTICTPFAIHLSTLGSADMPLTTFRTAAAVSMLQWCIQRRRSDAIFCALFTLFAGLTKAEGLPLAVFSAGVMLAVSANAIRRRSVAIDLAWFFAILIAGMGIWLAWRAGLPHTDENYLSRLGPSIIMENLHRLKDILGTFAAQCAGIRTFGFVWLLLPVMAALGYRGFRWAQTWMLWSLLLLQFGLYVVIYIITPWDVNELMGNSINRLITHMAPIAGLIIAMHWSALEAPATDADQSGSTCSTSIS